MKKVKELLYLLCGLSALLVGQEKEVFHATIPVLDMREYFNPSMHDLFITKLQKALREVGFFAVTHAKVNKEIIDRGYQASFDFFAKPREEKLLCYDPKLNGQRGYVPGESAKGQSYGDFKEFYHLGKEYLEGERPSSVFANVWPNQGSFKESMIAFYDELEAYVIPLGEAIAESLGEKKDLLTSRTKDSNTLVRTIHYPKNPPEGTLWAAEHTDINLFTILPRATAEGLQLKNNKGEWIDVIVPEDAFIVNVADMLENITNGEYHSGLHRVVASHDGYERYSIVYFVHPRLECDMSPLSSCIARTGGKQKYPSATAQEILEERLVDLGLASKEMMQHLAQSGFMEKAIEVGRASPKAMQKLKNAGLASSLVLQELDRQENR